MWRRFLFCTAGVLALLCVTGIPGTVHARGGFHGGSRGGFRGGRPTTFSQPIRGLDRRVFTTPFARPNVGFNSRFGRPDRDFDRRRDFDRDFGRDFNRRFFDPRFGTFSPGFSGFSPGFLGFPGITGFTPGFGGFSPGFGGF
jgi:hypothetical protein